MSSRIRSRSLCSRLSRQGFPCSWCGLGAVLLFVMAYPPVAETSSKEIPVLFSTTSQEHTPFTFQQESGQNLGSQFDMDANGISAISENDLSGSSVRILPVVKFLEQYSRWQVGHWVKRRSVGQGNPPP